MLEFEDVKDKCTNCGKKHNHRPSAHSEKEFPVCINCKQKEVEKLGGFIRQNDMYELNQIVAAIAAGEERTVILRYIKEYLELQNS